MVSFLFVDQITALDPGKSISGVKHVTQDDFFLEQNSLGETVFWSTLIGETLGQLCAWNVMQQFDFQRRPVAGMSRAVSILGQARLGDTISLHADIISLDDEAVVYDAEASVGDSVILKFEHALGPNLPMPEFIAPADAQAQFARIMHPDRGASMLATAPLADAPAMVSKVQHQQASYDGILQWQTGESAQAYKKITLAAPYFPDHFPRKPVLPLTVLMQCHMQFSQAFLQDWLGEQADTFTLREIRRVKMTRFVHPGDVITTTLKIKEHTDATILLRVETSLAQKRIAAMELLFNNESAA